MNDYRGYSAKVTLDEDRGVFHGQVVGTTDVITFEGTTPEELARAFRDSVDDYLAFCKQHGEEPDKPYSGRFVLRLSPELHRSVALAAKRSDLSMNEWIVSTLAGAVEKAPSAKKPPAGGADWLEQFAALAPQWLMSPPSPPSPASPSWASSLMPPLFLVLSQRGQEFLRMAVKEVLEESRREQATEAAARRF